MISNMAVNDVCFLGYKIRDDDVLAAVLVIGWDAMCIGK